MLPRGCVLGYSCMGRVSTLRWEGVRGTHTLPGGANAYLTVQVHQPADWAVAEGREESGQHDAQ